MGALVRVMRCCMNDFTSGYVEIMCCFATTCKICPRGATNGSWKLYESLLRASRPEMCLGKFLTHRKRGQDGITAVFAWRPELHLRANSELVPLPLRPTQKKARSPSHSIPYQISFRIAVHDLKVIEYGQDQSAMNACSRIAAGGRTRQTCVREFSSVSIPLAK